MRSGGEGGGDEAGGDEAEDGDGGGDDVDNDGSRYDTVGLRRVMKPRGSAAAGAMACTGAKAAAGDGLTKRSARHRRGGEARRRRRA